MAALHNSSPPSLIPACPDFPHQSPLPSLNSNFSHFLRCFLQMVCWCSLIPLVSFNLSKSVSPSFPQLFSSFPPPHSSRTKAQLLSRADKHPMYKGVQRRTEHNYTLIFSSSMKMLGYKDPCFIVLPTSDSRWANSNSQLSSLSLSDSFHIPDVCVVQENCPHQFGCVSPHSLLGACGTHYILYTTPFICAVDFEYL